jgi:hypothetical protein
MRGMQKRKYKYKQWQSSWVTPLIVQIIHSFNAEVILGLCVGLLPPVLDQFRSWNLPG